VTALHLHIRVALLASFIAFQNAAAAPPAAAINVDTSRADVDWKQPKEKPPTRMAALVIATPASATTWQVVAVQYTAY
jgi:hypothetical protein